MLLVRTVHNVIGVFERKQFIKRVEPTPSSMVCGLNDAVYIEGEWQEMVSKASLAEEPINLYAFGHKLIERSKVYLEDTKETEHDLLVKAEVDRAVIGLRNTVHTLTNFVIPSLRAIVTQTNDYVSGQVNLSDSNNRIDYFELPYDVTHEDIINAVTNDISDIRVDETTPFVRMVRDQELVPGDIRTGITALDALVQSRLTAIALEGSWSDMDLRGILDLDIQTPTLYEARDSVSYSRMFANACVRYAYGKSMYNNPPENTAMSLGEYNTLCRFLTSTAARAITRTLIDYNLKLSGKTLINRVRRDGTSGLINVSVLKPVLREFIDSLDGCVEMVVGAAIQLGSTVKLQAVQDDRDLYLKVFQTSSANFRRLQESKLTDLVRTGLENALVDHISRMDEEDLPSTVTAVQAEVRKRLKATVTVDLTTAYSVARDIFTKIIYSGTSIPTAMEVLDHQMNINPDKKQSEAMHETLLELYALWVCNQLTVS